MERLSEKAIEIIDELHTERLDYNSEYLSLIEAANRLASYEDTGLEPEEVKNWQDIYNEILTRTYGPFHQKIADWLKANEEGRLVVPPCKVGDTVFDIFGGSVKEETIVSITFLISQSVKHMTIHAENHRGAITELELLRFGKTWFLTHEEAEAALERKMEGST